MPRYLIIIFIIVAVGSGAVLSLYRQGRLPNDLLGRQHIQVIKEDKSVFKSQGPYDLALAEARKWHSDVETAFLDGDAAGTVWHFIFTSSGASGRGYEVYVEGGAVRGEEIEYSSLGAPLPENIISQDEAIARVKAMPAYKDAVIDGVEAVYGVGNKVWYWGVKTNKGIISIKAQ